MDKKGNKFREYLDQTGESVNSFSIRARIPTSTLYAIYHGREATRRTLMKICRNSKGKLTIKDFGY